MNNTLAPQVTDDILGNQERAIAPVAAGQRITTLDFIRGLAVMGILGVNIIGFGQASPAFIYPAAFIGPDGDPGGWLWIAQFVLFDGKMRGLFTLLFGASMYLFMERAWARGATSLLQARRLLFLLLFGLVHFYLIWSGDILVYYAIFGLIVLAFIGLEANWQLRIGLLGYAVGALFYAATFLPMHFVAETAFGQNADLALQRQELLDYKASSIADGLVEARLQQAGDYAGVVAHGIEVHGLEPLDNLIVLGFETIPLMLIGMALYRYGFFGGAIAREKMVAWGWTGLIVGALLHCVAGLWVKTTGFAYYAALGAINGLAPLPKLFMILGFAALMAVYSPRWAGWLAERVRAAGRIAFTNYLGTSILMMVVFQGWALGLFGQLNRPQLYIVMALVWVVMLAWSKPWLDRYRYGPLEWLWRCLTYGQLFPLQK